MLVGVDVLSVGRRTGEKADMLWWICAETLLASYKVLVFITAFVLVASRGWGLVLVGYG